jgi:hypothetical protein
MPHSIMGIYRVRRLGLTEHRTDERHDPLFVLCDREFPEVIVYAGHQPIERNAPPPVRWDPRDRHERLAHRYDVRLDFVATNFVLHVPTS